MIFFDSTESESIKRFRNKGFRSFKIMISEDRNKGVRRYFSVTSHGRRNKVFSFLFNKWVWDTLSKMEFLLFINFPETFETPLVACSLRAVTLVGKQKVRENLIKLNTLIPQNNFLSHKSYYGLLNNLLISFVEGEEKLPRVPKYSGYTKHYKDQGSLRDGSYNEPLAVDEDYFVQEDFLYEFLTGMISFP